MADNRLLTFWDSFDFADSMTVKDPERGEQMLVDFIAEFPNATDSERAAAVRQMFSKAKSYPQALAYFAKQYAHYLYDPNSPMRNDAYYEPVLESLLDLPGLSEAEEYRLSTRLEMVRRNKVGMKAANFGFEVPEKVKRSLYDIHAPYILLFFYEPGCSNCQRAIYQLRASKRFKQLTDKGMLKILAVYAMGNRDIWSDYQPEIPEAWINGFDSDKRIVADKLYDIKASPTIYLLDSIRTVVLKDSDLPQVALKLKTLGL